MPQRDLSGWDDTLFSTVAVNQSAQSQRPISAWAPLRRPAYRALWFATLASNIGSWMQDMGAAWLMTTLTPSPVLIALVQAATSLPVLFLAVPAGALADIVERRRVLLFSDVWALASVAALTYYTLTANIGPGILLALTFSVGVGATFEAPALQAVVTELVPRAELPSAVALNSAGYNLARAVGPALGGIVLAKLGAGVNFFLNSLTFSVVLIVLYRWHEERKRSLLPAERFSGALRAGIRYVAYAPALRLCLSGQVRSSCSEARSGHFCRLSFVYPGTALQPMGCYWQRSAPARSSEPLACHT